MRFRKTVRLLEKLTQKSKIHQDQTKVVFVGKIFFKFFLSHNIQTACSDYWLGYTVIWQLPAPFSLPYQNVLLRCTCIKSFSHFSWWQNWPLVKAIDGESQDSSSILSSARELIFDPALFFVPWLPISNLQGSHLLPPIFGHLFYLDCKLSRNSLSQSICTMTNTIESWS